MNDRDKEYGVDNIRINGNTMHINIYVKPKSISYIGFTTTITRDSITTVVNNDTK